MLLISIGNVSIIYFQVPSREDSAASQNASSRLPSSRARPSVIDVFTIPPHRNRGCEVLIGGLFDAYRERAVNVPIPLASPLATIWSALIATWSKLIPGPRTVSTGPLLLMSSSSRWSFIHAPRARTVCWNSSCHRRSSWPVTALCVRKVVWKSELF